MKKLVLALIIIFSTGLCIYAQQFFQLQFPVKCTINKDCWLVNYVDDDFSTNWHDYTGGRETYEGHTGTDIAIKDISKMKQGVDVIAAASGIVVTTRDGVPDKNALSQNINQLKKIGCGNRVAIKNSGGFITDYCHMKNGSIKVKKGDFVTTGQTLGQIGMSGLSEMPHLHINVQKDNQFYDPFTGLERYTKGPKNPLWAPSVLQQLSYKPTIVYNAGVSDEPPKLLDIRNDKYKNYRLNFFSNMIIVWLDMFHVETGDTIDIIVKNQDGATFIQQHVIVAKSNAKKLLYVGKKKPTGGFKKGTYNVQITYKIPNTNICDNKSFSFTIY